MTPQHVAIIMDGNRRWAKARHLPAVVGHRKVVEGRIEELIDHAGHLGISHITFWAFSTENWNRPEDEVRGHMDLFRLALSKYAQKMIDKGARLRVIGDLSRFESDIKTGLENFITASEKNNKITVTFALNYGGRDEIVRATQRLLEEVQSSKFKVQIKEEDLEQNLDTVGMPDPDLIIRTGGEQRLSGFMLWQCEYSEFYFTDVLMPDFDSKQFDLAIEEFEKRERRKGK